MKNKKRVEDGGLREGGVNKIKGGGLRKDIYSVNVKKQDRGTIQM